MVPLSVTLQLTMLPRAQHHAAVTQQAGRRRVPAFRDRRPVLSPLCACCMPLCGCVDVTVQGRVESVLESPIFAASLLVGSVGLWVLALTAGGAAWIDYSHLFDESKLVHVTTVDFFLLSAFAPFWMYNDAQLRDWKPRCAEAFGCSRSRKPMTAIPVVLSYCSMCCDFAGTSWSRCSLSSSWLAQVGYQHPVLARAAHATHSRTDAHCAGMRSPVPSAATKGEVIGRAAPLN